MGCCKENEACSSDSCCSKKIDVMDFLSNVIITCPFHPGEEYKWAEVEDGNTIVLSYPCECTFKYQINISEV